MNYIYCNLKTLALTVISENLGEFNLSPADYAYNNWWSPSLGRNSTQAVKVVGTKKNSSLKCLLAFKMDNSWLIVRASGLIGAWKCKYMFRKL